MRLCVCVCVCVCVCASDDVFEPELVTRGLPSDYTRLQNSTISFDARVAFPFLAYVELIVPSLFNKQSILGQNSLKIPPLSNQ